MVVRNKTKNNRRKNKKSPKTRRKTHYGGKRNVEYVTLDLHRNLTNPNIGRTMHVIQDPVFSNTSNEVADVGFLVRKRMGEVDEEIEVMKKGRKQKPHVQKLYRFTYDDSDAPAMAFSGKQIRKCAPSTKTPVNKSINFRSKKNVSIKSPIKKAKSPIKKEKAPIKKEKAPIVKKTRSGRITQQPDNLNYGRLGGINEEVGNSSKKRKIEDDP
jgi:hypothetical protein